jgi:hypothetical protein
MSAPNKVEAGAEYMPLEQRWAIVFNTLRSLERGMAAVLKGYQPLVAAGADSTRHLSTAEIDKAYPEQAPLKVASLSFDTLRMANIARTGKFKNAKGGLAHRALDGSDWSPSQWLQAVTGELGEFANIRKKFERGDMGFGEYKVLAAKELADVQCYLDILARRCLDHALPGQPRYVDPSGVDLGEATRDKLNEVSKRFKLDIYITAANNVVDAT